MKIETEVQLGNAFWVLEMASEPEGGPPRYWSGNDKGWAYKIEDAIKFVSRADVERSKAGTWNIGEPVEHDFIGRLTLASILDRTSNFILTHRKSSDYYGATDTLVQDIAAARAALAKAGGE